MWQTLDDSNCVGNVYLLDLWRWLDKIGGAVCPRVPGEPWLAVWWEWATSKLSMNVWKAAL